LKRTSPPALLSWLVGRLLDSRVRYAALGDFDERFRAVARKKGWTKACLFYGAQTTLLLPSYLANLAYWSTEMLKNYLTTAWRNIRKHKAEGSINVLGLALGIASCLLIYLYVRHEYSYDRFHANADRIYRTYVTEDPPERDAFSYVEAPYPLAGALKESLPGVEETVRIHLRNVLVRTGDRTFAERCHLVDPAFFRVFSFPLVRGTAAGTLGDLRSAVLTERTARKIFGHADPLGRALAIKVGDKFLDFTISAVAADPPTNSSVRFDVLIPFDNVREYMNERTFTQWLNVNYETYVLLDRPRPAAEIDAALVSLVRKHYPQDYAAYVTVRVQPLTSVHLDSRIPGGFEPASDPFYSIILMAIAVLILGVACVNFTTLAVGRSAGRAREVGVRKTMGADRRQIVRQFLGEALLLSFSALVAGLVLAAVLLPTFNVLTGKSLALAFGLDTVLFLVGLVFVVGLAAGSYPALFLSRLEPIEIMGRTLRIGGKRRLVNGLVVGQFAVSIGLIVCAMVIGAQFRFLVGRDIGFNREQVVVVPNRAPSAERAAVVERLRNSLAGRREILGVTGASSTFAKDWTLLGFDGPDGAFKQFAQITVDHDFFRTMELRLAAGRWFSRDFGTDPAEAIVVNEALLRYFGWDSGVGKSLPGPNFPPHRVVGVVRDFNFESLRSSVRPAVLVLDPTTLLRGTNDISTSFPPRSPNFINVRLAPNGAEAGIGLLKSAWTAAAPGIPFSLTFLDEDIQAQYGEVERWRRMVGFASGFTVVIAALGLFGLTALTVARRRKEIGVRKVLGASSGRIVAMFSAGFGRLVLAANIVAWPAAYFIMRRWLQGFAYRIDVPVWSFLAAGSLALVVAMATIAWQAVKAAQTDPVETIRYE
jgi:putative ABC transport system permease protein